MIDCRPFLKSVEEFLAFVEGPKNSPEADVIWVVRHLKALLAGVEVILEGPWPANTNAEDSGSFSEKNSGVYDAQRNVVAARFAHLPFQHYKKFFNPYDREEEPVFGDLTDDLQDLYHDMWDGYRLYKSGWEGDACNHWQTLYWHWSHHATAALYALDAYRCDNWFFSIERGDSPGEQPAA